MDSATPDQPPHRSFSRALKIALDLSFLSVFLPGVARVFIEERRAEVLMLFLFPPAACYLFARLPETRPSTKLVTTFFLAMISAGDLAVWAMPSLRRNPQSGMSPHEFGVVQWYLGWYLVFVFVVLPPVLFIRPFIDRRRGRRADFSTVTCILGLFAWLIMAPFILYMVGHFVVYGPLPTSQ